MIEGVLLALLIAFALVLIDWFRTAFKKRGD